MYKTKSITEENEYLIRRRGQDKPTKLQENKKNI
jgi:hypothetical protein